MSVEEHKALVRRWFEEANKGEAAFMAAMDELFATNIVHHGGGGEEIHGLKDFKQWFSAMFFSALSDFHATIEAIVAEGDKVVARVTWSGINTGEFKGISPTNKKVMDWEVLIARIVDGKIAEIWARADTLGEMQQLGLVPIPKEK